MKPVPYFLLFNLISFIFLSGCASSADTYYADTEEILDTRGGPLGDNGLYHDVLYEPDAVSLNFEGYIVGLDKSPREAVGAKSIDDVEREKSQAGMRDVVHRINTDSKFHYVSHIMRNEGNPYGDGNCLLYSVYQYHSENESYPSKPAPLAPPCAGETFHDPADAYQGSFKAVDRLTAHIKNNVENRQYSQIIFVIMGWNTTQIEAVRNFRSIASNMRRAAADKSKFNPVFLGITWSSYWDQSFLDFIVQPGSYRNKSNDADELGAGWLAHLIREVTAVSPELPSIVIGHSFGARAASMAVCMRPQLEFTDAGPETAGGETSGNGIVDLLIGLQPAVSINRFLTDGGLEDIHYPGACANAKRVVMTASSRDTALGSAVWADMTGTIETWRQTCKHAGKRMERSFQCVKAKSNGKVVPESSAVSQDFVYVDASDLIFFNHPNTGGGAHSDIYRPETGTFLWQWFQSINND